MIRYWKATLVALLFFGLPILSIALPYLLLPSEADAYGAFAGILQKKRLELAALVSGEHSATPDMPEKLTGLNPVPTVDPASGTINLQTVDALELSDPTPIGVGDSPRRADGLLAYAFRMSAAPPEFANGGPIYGLKEEIRRAIDAPYALVRTSVTEPDDSLVEQRLLIDQRTNTLLAAYELPLTQAHPSNEEVIRADEEALTALTGGTFYLAKERSQPAFGTNVLRSYIQWPLGIMLAGVIVGIPLIVGLVHSANEEEKLAEIRRRGLYPAQLECPVSGEMTDSLKHVTLVKIRAWIVYQSIQRTPYLAKADLARNAYWKQFRSNLLTGHVLTILLLPYWMVRGSELRQHGHSAQAIIDTLGPLDERVGGPPQPYAALSSRNHKRQALPEPKAGQTAWRM